MVIIEYEKLVLMIGTSYTSSGGAILVQFIAVIL